MASDHETAGSTPAGRANGSFVYRLLSTPVERMKRVRFPYDPPHTFTTIAFIGNSIFQWGVQSNGRLPSLQEG